MSSVFTQIALTAGSSIVKRMRYLLVQCIISVYTSQQDAEWARVETATNTFLCRAVIVTCPPHLAGQCMSPASVDSLSENLTEAGGK